MNNEHTGRRDFLKTSFKTIVIGALTLNSIDITQLLASAGEDSESGNTTTKVINISDYPELASVGGYTNITKNVLVIRTSSSKFLAINTICTHKKCEVDFDGSSFECPCHGSTYSKTGKVTGGPATKNLRSYKTTYNADDGTLEIDM